MSRAISNSSTARTWRSDPGGWVVGAFAGELRRRDVAAADAGRSP